ncbi:MAG: response regulator [Anaerolineales bacterium]|nr:response regulator [Anaerolineales bacterium]
MNQKAKVLIVDDEPNNVDFLEQALEDSGYQLITATNGQEALNKIQSEQPDLVLLDLAMPIMDGFAVLERVKADQSLRDIPIIIISAEHDSKSVVRGIKQGAEDYLTKPVNVGLLVKKVKEYMG